MASSNEHSVSVGKTTHMHITLSDYTTRSALLEIMRVVTDNDFQQVFSVDAIYLAKEIQEQWKNL